jgi:hypothetical protein
VREKNSARRHLRQQKQNEPLGALRLMALLLPEIKRNAFNRRRQ